MSAAPTPDIATCASCGKLFPRVHLHLCSTCAGDQEARFRLIREYLVANEGASFNEIAQATGLSRGEVAKFYESGRLVSTGGDLLGAPQTCTCGGVGARCTYCRLKLARKFDDPRSGDRRRTLGEIAAAAADKRRVHYVRRNRRDAS